MVSYFSPFTFLVVYSTKICVYYIGIHYSLSDPDCSGNMDAAEYSSPVTSSITDPAAAIDEQAGALDSFLPRPLTVAAGAYCEQVISTTAADTDTTDQPSKRISGHKRDRVEYNLSSSSSSVHKRPSDTAPSEDSDHTATFASQPAFPWRSPTHTSTRNRVREQIVRTIFDQKPTERVTTEWVYKLKSTSSTIEDLLYAEARSLTEYSDISTLKSRLLRLARHITTRTVVRDRIEAILLLTKRDSFATDSEKNDYLERLPGLSLQLETMLYVKAVDLREYSDMSTLEARLAACMTPTAPKLGSSPFPAHASAPQRGAVTTSSSSISSVDVEQPRLVHTGNNTTTSGIEDRTKIIKQQQQRLLLLQHASKCTVQVGEICPVTPHCALFKTLWQHVLSCKDKECTTKHCASSRYALHHYSMCKQSDCQVCGSIRLDAMTFTV